MCFGGRFCPIRLLMRGGSSFCNTCLSCGLMGISFCVERFLWRCRAALGGGFALCGAAALAGVFLPCDAAALAGDFLPCGAAALAGGGCPIPLFCMFQSRKSRESILSWLSCSLSTRPARCLRSFWMASFICLF